MDGEQLLQCVTFIREGKLSLARIIKAAMQVDENAANAAALSATVRDGTIFPAGAGIKTIQEYGQLLYALQTLAEAGDEIAKAAKSAIKGTDDKGGQDGLGARFAELLREHSITSAKVAGVGTCYIQGVVVAMPPNKTHPQYDEFRQWCKDHDLTTESWHWSAFQKLVKELLEQAEAAGLTKGPPAEGSPAEGLAPAEGPVPQSAPLVPGVPKYITVRRSEEVRLRKT